MIPTNTDRLNEADVRKIYDVLDNKIMNAEAESDKKLYRTLHLLITAGLNLGISTTELRNLTWNFFFSDTGEWKDGYIIHNNMATIKLRFDDVLIDEVNEFVADYPINNYTDPIFVDGENIISSQRTWFLMNYSTKEAGIDKPFGLHAMRKYWAYQCWKNANNRYNALEILRRVFNHLRLQITIEYIGLTDEEIESMNIPKSKAGYGLEMK